MFVCLPTNCVYLGGHRAVDVWGACSLARLAASEIGHATQSCAKYLRKLKRRVFQWKLAGEHRDLPEEKKGCQLSHYACVVCTALYGWGHQSCVDIFLKPNLLCCALEMVWLRLFCMVALMSGN